MTTPGGMFQGDPEDIERGLDEWVVGLERNAALYQELRDRVEAVRLSATSPSGVVTVTVDANGALVDAAFSDRVRQTNPDELRSQLLMAIAAARERIVGEVRELTDRTLGDGDGAARESADRIVGYYSERFPAAAEPQGAARRPHDDDDEFDGGSIFNA